MPLREQGYPIYSKTQEGQPFVAADLAAKLSGVNLSTVRAVIAALATIEAVHGVTAHDLIDAHCLPLALPDSHRAEATRKAYRHVIGNLSDVPENAHDYIRTSSASV